MMLIVLLYTCVLFVANTSPGVAQEIRLVGSSAVNEGRVEVFRSGQWQTVCDDGWDLNDADVACRQLGYGYAIRVVTNALFGQGTGGQWEASFSCTGSESRLENCLTSSSSCSHSEDVGVICSTSSLQQGSLRLAGSSIFTTSLYAGRLEIYVNGQWGTICDDFWGNNEANVACRQMGFEGAYDSDWTLSSSGSSSQRIWLDDVTCTGSESQLINCNHRDLGVQNCLHSEDIGIRCTRSVTSTLSSESATFSISTTSSHTTSSVTGIIVGVVTTAAFLFGVPCVTICIVVVILAQKKTRTTRVVRAPVTTTAGNTVAVPMVNQQPQQQQVVYQPQPNYQQQQGGYPPQPDYQQQQGEYPPQPDYQQQQGGYPPQPDYQQQQGGYPPQSDYQQQQGGYPPQPDYQQQQGGYPPQPGYQQQQGGYPPQPDYQQQQGGYPPQPDYQQQVGYQGQQPAPVPSHPQPTDPIEDNPPPYP